jgi:hypothetical protein
MAGHRTHEAALAEAALISAASATGVVPDSKGYRDTVEANLIQAVTPELWIAARKDLEGGKGSELDRKFRAAYSSSALVVNTFVPMQAGVSIPGIGFIAGIPQLEQERSGGARGFKPTLDVVIGGGEVNLFVESKCREYLDAGEADFSVAWPRLAADRLSVSAARVYGDIYAGVDSYQPVDAPQLLNDILAAEKCAREQNCRVVFLYAYWEPRDADNYAVFEKHREQAARLLAPLTSKRVTVLSMSYRQLWEYWEQAGEPHISQLRKRYDVDLT